MENKTRGPPYFVLQAFSKTKAYNKLFSIEGASINYVTPFSGSGESLRIVTWMEGGLSTSTVTQCLEIFILGLMHLNESEVLAIK